MAGRAAARLLKERLDLPARAEEVVEPEESESDSSEAPGQPFNPFSLLTDDEEDQTEPTDEPEDEPEEEPQKAPPAAARPQAGGGASGGGGRRKKKGKAKAKTTAAADAAAASSSKRGGEAEEEDIDSILQELAITPAAAGPPSAQQRATADGRPLLVVDTRLLRADDELRRMFGTRLLEAEGDDDNAGGGFAGASRRVRRLAARGLLRRQPLKPGVLIQPKDHWPRFDGGFTMETRGLDGEGRQVFNYAYSQAYAAVQDLYEECQATFDPNAIAGLLQAHPYHLDALLTMHDLYRNMGENSYADEMLERCLYALEMGAHPSLWGALASAGGAHVPFEEENVPLFIALFRYVQTLSRRGLHRTALEACKVLLGLNSDDPMGAACCIDYLALRAGEHAWLQRYVHEHGSGLPNVTYSLALSRWQQEHGPPPNRGRGGGASTSGAPAPASATRQQQGGGGGAGGGEPESLGLLVTAVQMHPLVVVKLQQKLKDKGVGHEAEWAALLRRSLFAQGGGRDSASLCHLVDIFVERQHLLWKAPEVQAWLRQACEEATNPDSPVAVLAADWACMREQAFPASEVNLYGHLRVHDFSDLVHRLPPEEMHGMQQGAAVHEADLAAIRQMVQQAQGDMTNEELQAANPLAMLLRTLLPWVNVGQELGADIDEGSGGEGGAAAGDVQQEQQPREREEDQ